MCKLFHHDSCIILKLRLGDLIDTFDFKSSLFSSTIISFSCSITNSSNDFIASCNSMVINLFS